MIKHSTGIVCVTTTKERLEAFGLHPATTKNTDPNGTNFYVSTDFLPGTTTGVSAADRVATIRAMCDVGKNTSDMFSKPGHMFPLCANPDGVLARAGHTESTFDFCRLAEEIRFPVGALAELMGEDGEMLRAAESRAFSEKYNIPMVYVADIKAYRLCVTSSREVFLGERSDGVRGRHQDLYRLCVTSSREVFGGFEFMPAF